MGIFEEVEEGWVEEGWVDGWNLKVVGSSPIEGMILFFFFIESAIDR